MISNRCQVITTRSQVVTCPIISTIDITIRKTTPIQRIGTNTRKRFSYRDRYEYKKMVPIQGIGTNTRKSYRYKGSVWIQENNTVLRYSISIDFKLFTTINKRIMSHYQVGKRVSKQANIQVKQSSTEDKISEQSLITKAPDETQEWLGLRCEFKIQKSFA